MEDWTFEPQAFDLDPLGQDFLDFLSQPVEHYTFLRPTQDDLYRADDCFDFQEFVCLSPTEQTTGFNDAAPEIQQTDIFGLLEIQKATVCLKPSSTSQIQSRAESPKPRRTRTFEEGLSQFAATQAVEKLSRHRKPFSSERRKEVDHIRKAGACIRCRLMKTSVSFIENPLTKE